MFLEWEKKGRLEEEAMTDMTIMADTIVVIDTTVENVMTDMTEIGIMSEWYNCMINFTFTCD